MKVWTFKHDGTANTGWVNIEIGQEVTVFHSHSLHTTFGERAHLERTTAQHLVFITESGAVVKTAIDNLFRVVGKAAKAHYCVSLRKYDDFEHMLHENVRYWNNKKCCFETK